MNSIEDVARASLCVAALAICPQVSAAGTFTGKEFLDWSGASQASYIRTSVTMAAMVVMQTNEKTGACIDEWYFGQPAYADQRNRLIQDRIQEFSEYHPSAVIAVVLQEHCGKFR